MTASKVVDTCKVADIEVRELQGRTTASPTALSLTDPPQDEGKRVYCRCWRSSTFPLCDGSHGKHNAATGDNVGPLIVSKAK